MSQLATVDFSLIRYANCWEDADVLLHALPDVTGKDVCCIASAGDNALALLPKGCTVTAADISAVQLYLTELKQVAFAQLAYDELLLLFGVSPSSSIKRFRVFKHIEVHLSASAKQYLNENKKLIDNGIVNAGKFERYFRAFRTYLLPLVHSRSSVTKLLQTKPASEQIAFYSKRWNTWRWKLLMNIFFSKRVMGKYGRDPEFLKHVQLSVPEYIRQKAEQHLMSTDCQANYFLHMIFTGSFGTHLPFYLREENYTSIRNNIHKLTIAQCSAQDMVQQKPFAAYCLSNIFEYMSDNEFKELVNNWSNYIPKASRLLFWNLMAPRSFSEAVPQSFAKHQPFQLPADNGFFYSRFITEDKI
ncbi:MAG: DUF3419 family protein [Sphingobacteriales bacterium]|nr:MAG: DUF3419 family protein [Sphingobacteriales bacterium]